MQELILLISRCVSKDKKDESGEDYFCFHFNGYYAGEKIRVIHLYFSFIKLSTEHLSKGEDYLLWVKRKQVRRGILVVELIKYKKII